MFSATVSVGASVSSWLIATIPRSRACRGDENETALAVELDDAVVGGEAAVEDLGQRRLPRAVLPRKRVDLAGLQIKRGVVKRENSGERLADAVHADERPGPGCSSAVVLDAGRGGHRRHSPKVHRAFGTAVSLATASGIERHARGKPAGSSEAESRLVSGLWRLVQSGASSTHSTR